MSGFIKMVLSALNCPCKETNIKDSDILLDLNSHREKSELLVDFSKQSLAYSLMETWATSKNKEVLRPKNSLVNSINAEALTTATMLPVNVSNLSAARFAIPQLLSLENQQGSTKYISIDPKWNKIAIYENLQEGNFKLLERKSITQEMPLNIVDSAKSCNSNELVLGIGLYPKKFIGKCLNPSLLEETSESTLDYSNKYYIKLNDKATITNELKSERSCHKEKLTRTFDNTIERFSNSNKVYFKMKDAYELTANEETFVVLSNNYILKIKTFNPTETLFNTYDGSDCDRRNESLDSLRTSCLMQISIKLYELGSQQSKEFIFDPTDFKVTIGRSSNCDIRCNDPSISKIHATIFYCIEEERWIIMDGHKAKRSSNGSWILLNENWCCQLQPGIKHYFKYTDFRFCINVES